MGNKTGTMLSGRGLHILIFCGVAGAVAGGLYALYPATDGKAEKTAAAETAPAVPAAVPETAAEAPAPAPAPSAVTVTEAQPEISAEVTAEKKADPAAVTAEKKTSDAVPVQKGVKHPSDPADEDPYHAPDILEPGGFEVNLQAIRKLMKQGKKDIAEARIQALIAETSFGSPEYRKAAKVLNQLHAGKAAAGTMMPYEVRPGDSLIRLARRYHVATAQLAAVNRLSPEARLQIGQKLQIPAGSTWRVLVSKRTRLLCVYRNEQLYRVFDIGIGRRNLTPEGKFTVREVVNDPPYPKPHVGMIPADSPRNPLGPCWIGLADEQGNATGYGIHGTADESSVTRNLSSGCIRMRNAEVKILRELLPLGTVVVIEP